MARVALLSVASDYDVAAHFLDDIANALRGLGHAVCRVQSFEDLLSLANFSPEWILSINGVALDVELHGQPLPQCFGASHLSLTVDNPLLFPHRWERAERGVVTVVDSVLPAYVQKQWPHLDRVCYLPHGACGERGPSPSCARPIDVLVTGTYCAPESQAFPPFVEEWIERHAACTSCDSPWHSILIAETLSDTVAHGIAQDHLEKTVRFRRRNALVCGLTEQGIAAHVVGPGWHQHPNAQMHTLLGVKPFSELVRLFGQSKIVVHTAASTDSHERALTAMLQGAAVIVPSSHFWTVHFGHEIPTVQELLNDPRRRHQWARHCQEIVANGHTWEARFRNFQW